MVFSCGLFVATDKPTERSVSVCTYEIAWRLNTANRSLNILHNCTIVGCVCPSVMEIPNEDLHKCYLVDVSSLQLCSKDPAQQQDTIGAARILLSSRTQLVQ